MCSLSAVLVIKQSSPRALNTKDALMGTTEGAGEPQDHLHHPPMLTQPSSAFRSGGQRELEGE